MSAAKGAPAVSETVTWRKTGDEAVILDLETSEYYSANETGTFIWELLGAGRSPEKIAEALAAEYGLARERADADTAEFLGELAKLKIVRHKAGK